MKRKSLLILLFTVLIIFSAAFFTNVTDARMNRKSLVTEAVIAPTQAFDAYLDAIYNEAGLRTKGLRKEVFRKALIGYYNLKEDGELTKKKDVLTVVDFSISSVNKRMWVIDLRNKKVLFHTVVAHGKNSGWNNTVKFSNTPNSNMSSLGFYVTSETYCGKHGLSLRLDGMDEGFNDNARQRAIVIHGADYANESITKTLGRLGRSFGCPAVPTSISGKLITAIADQTALFIYYPDKKYEATTKYYNLDKAVSGFNAVRTVSMLSE